MGVHEIELRVHYDATTHLINRDEEISQRGNFAKTAAYVVKIIEIG